PGNLPPGGTRDHFLIQSVVKDGHIVGYITYYKGYPAADAAYIDLLLIDEKERGNGSSGEVVRRLLDALKSEDFHSVRCAVSLKNPHAMRFWYRMGFDRVTAVDIRAHDAGVELQKTIE
ncbi:MAG: GNAT family N-acetyltransferase, partial [Oscillospiraceae bacterium]|nr:GNAT family N-acetyltransferase [Oscillospiraceae bacterium]